MPCTAKKAEIRRPEHFTDGEQDVDFVLTTTEITRMIQEAKLAAVPGICFGVEGYIRLSYCYSQAEIQEGMNRLEAFLKTLR